MTTDASALLRRRAVLITMAGLVSVMLAASFLYRLDHPSLAVRMVQRAPQQQAMGGQSEAMDAVRQLMEKMRQNPDDADTLLALSGQFMHIGAFDKALTFLDRVLVNEPGNLRALHFKGVALSRLGKHQEAADYFNQVLEMEKDNVSAHFNLGILQKHYLDKGEEAQAHFQIVLSSPQADEHLKDAAQQELKE